MAALVYTLFTCIISVFTAETFLNAQNFSLFSSLFIIWYDKSLQQYCTYVLRKCSVISELSRTTCSSHECSCMRLNCRRTLCIMHTSFTKVTLWKQGVYIIGYGGLLFWRRTRALFITSRDVTDSKSESDGIRHFSWNPKSDEYKNLFRFHCTINFSQVTNSCLRWLFTLEFLMVVLWIY